MFTKHFVRMAIALVMLMGAAVVATAGVPTHISYQGMLLNNDNAYTGDAEFKFALADTNRNTFYWSNDGTLGYPTHSVTVHVQDGIFSVLLGAPPMFPLDPDLVKYFDTHQGLYVWVDTGHGETPLGVLPISSVLFAEKAEYALKSPGTFTAASQIWSQAVGSQGRNRASVTPFSAA